MNGMEWRGQETGKENRLTPKAVANEHERRARQPLKAVDDTVPLRPDSGRPTRAIRPICSFKHRFGKFLH